MKLKSKTVILICIMCVLYLLLNTELNTELYNPSRTYPSSGYVKYFPSENYTYKGNNSKPVILLWTSFYNEASESWRKRSEPCMEDCPWKCILTTNKGKVSKSNAVLFHLSDTYWVGKNTEIHRMFFKFPAYRRPDQVWVVYHIEPLSKIWGNLRVFNEVFNWTQTYRRDSDIFNPYGEFRPTTNEEAESVTKQLESNSYFREKNNSALIVNSLCNDNARRFRIVNIQSKYIKVDKYGECGRGCPDNRDSCEKLHPSYKFYLAFENSYCRDYITEKYWRRPMYHQIPIVAWRQNYSGLVVPNSYINVFDFPDIDSAGRYIAEVDRNETLFNSYFEWMKHYKTYGRCDLCRTCEALHTKRIPHQVYTNFEGWLTDDTCYKSSVMRVLHQTVDRFLFDGTFRYTQHHTDAGDLLTRVKVTLKYLDHFYDKPRCAIPPAGRETLEWCTIS